MEKELAQKQMQAAGIVDQLHPEPQYQITEQDDSLLDNNFVYHAPKADKNQTARYQFLRNEARKLAMSVMQHVPYGRERSLAVTKIEEAIFWANAGIARGE